MSERLNHSEQGIFLEKLRTRLADYYLERNPEKGPIQALRYASQSTNLLLRHIKNAPQDNPEKYCKRVRIKATEPGLQTDRFLTIEGINLVLEAEKPEDVGIVFREPSTYLLSEERLQAIQEVLKERHEVNLAHINELHPQYLEQLSEKMRGWKAISSVGHDNGPCFILWESTDGIWIEERHFENRKQKRSRLSRLNSAESVREAVEMLIEH